MPFRDADRSLRDIVDAIGLIEQFTVGMDYEAFRSNPMAVAAVERKLQIISEAAIRLGDEAQTRCPRIAWSEIRGIGNWLRHAYDAIELPTIWKTVKDDLPQLRADVQSVLPPTVNPNAAAPR